MIRKFNNGNNLIISHIADIDGMGGVILSMLIYDKLDIILCEPHELDAIFKELCNIKDNYENIYIVDLCIRDTSLFEYINDNFSNVLHFDHHLNEYDRVKFKWSTTINEIEGFKPSGTSLFYDFLVRNFYNNKYIVSKYTKDFVEAIRSYDTWDFKNTGNLDGKRLTEIFSIIGIDEFINRFYLKIKENYFLDSFCFDEDDIKMYEKLEIEISEYIELCDKSLIVTNFLGYKVGVSISERYRSEVGNVLSSRHRDLDFILIANFVRGSFSFRTVNDIDLNEIASKIGGGGHKKAAGAVMTDENKKLFFECL